MTAADRRAEYLRTVPILYRGMFARAFEGAGSPRQAIKAMCLACCNHERAEVRHCTVTVCALFRFRPYQAESAEATE
jgi:hypothetical protein